MMPILSTAGVFLKAMMDGYGYKTDTVDIYK